MQVALFTHLEKWELRPGLGQQSMLSCSDEVLPPTCSPGGFSGASFPTPWCCRPGRICPSLLSWPHPHTAMTKGLGMGSGTHPTESQARASLQPPLP